MSSRPMKIGSVLLLDSVLVTGAGPAHQPWNDKRTFQAYGTTSAGVGATAVLIQVSNVASPNATTHWITLATISLTLGTTLVTDGLASDAPWRHVRANVQSISGTNATVSVSMGA